MKSVDGDVARLMPGDDDDSENDFELYDFYCTKQKQVNAIVSQTPHDLIPSITPDAFRNLMILFYMYSKQIEELCKEHENVKQKTVLSRKFYECTSEIAKYLVTEPGNDPDFCWSDVETSKYKRNKDDNCVALNGVIGILRDIVNNECKGKGNDNVAHATSLYAFKELAKSLNDKNVCPDIIF